MANFCPQCGAPVSDMSPVPKFCPKCGQPLSAAAAEPSVPAQSPAVSVPAQSPFYDLSDLPSRLQYIIAMVCLAVSIGAMIKMNSLINSLSIDSWFDFDEFPILPVVPIAMFNAAVLICPCVVINKMLSVKRSAIGLWSVRLFYVLSAATAFLPVFISGMVSESEKDYPTLISQIKAGMICLSVVYTVALAALGFALTDLKDHTAGGRWFAGSGIALILCAILSLISDIYEFVNFEKRMFSYQPDSWLSAVQLESIVLFVLFIVGYVFMPGDDRQKPECGSKTDFDGSTLGVVLVFDLILGLFLGLCLVREGFPSALYWMVFVFVILVLLSCCSISYKKQLPADTVEEGNAKAVSILDQDNEAE